ncbi:MAG: spondin domain-containing protein, partial [Rhodothermales bacterium]
SDGSMQAVPLSPGVWVVHADPAPLFTSGAVDRGRGLEAIAEDGTPGMLLDAIAAKVGFGGAVFNTPEGASAPGPIGPGNAYTFSLVAAPGARLSVVTMFIPSNDLFFAPDENGIALWNPDGNPVTGDVTAQVLLWDAGSEANEEPGVGPNQVQRQSGPNTGPEDGDTTVRLVNDAFTYPAVSDVIRVTIEAVATAIEERDPVPNRFTLHQNYPNPFNPETTIAFDLHEAAPVRLTVYNILGQQVANLFDGFRSAGTYQVQWDGRDSRGFRTATGIYLYKLDVGGSTAVRKMVLLQ